MVYNLADAVYASKNISAATQVANLYGLHFNSTGTKMYVLDVGTSITYQYSLSTAYDVSTASYDSVSYDATEAGGNGATLRFSTDGTKMYVGRNDTGVIYQYTLSTAWDLSTASYASKSYDAHAVTGNDIYEIFFKPDGTKLYCFTNTGAKTYQFSLSTAWDISTASSDSKNFGVAGFAAITFLISYDGKKLYVSNSYNNILSQYSLTTAWDISTASSDGVSLNTSVQFSVQKTLWMSDNGYYLYIGGGDRKIYEYHMPPFPDVSTPALCNLSLLGV